MEALLHFFFKYKTISFKNEVHFSDAIFCLRHHTVLSDIVLYLGLDFGKALKFNPNEQGENLARFYQMMHERFSIKNMAKAKPAYDE